MKLQEASRNELLALAKSQTITRYNKAEEYKGFSIRDIKTDEIFSKDMLVIVCRVGDYEDIVALEDILIWVQMCAEQSTSTKNQINSKVVTQAIMNSIDGMDILINCSCPDFKYRFAYMATQLGYKYGEPQNERNKFHRTNKENYGSMCFDGNTLVATETGFKPIKDVVVGDKVFTHKGRLRKVTEVMKRYSDEVVKLHLSTQDVITTKSHPFYICSGKGKNFRFERAENLKQSNDYCLAIPVIQLPDIDSPITNNNAFMLGYFLANGNIGYRSDMEKLTLTSGVDMSINAEYKDIYEKLFANMGYDITYHQGRGNSATYYIKSNELRDFIIKFGGFNYKELSHKYISKEVLNWNKEAKLELIRGFFAGDGLYCSSMVHLNMRFLNTNKSIIENLYLIIRSLGIHAKCFKYEREPRVIRR